MKTNYACSGARWINTIHLVLAAALKPGPGCIRTLLPTREFVNKESGLQDLRMVMSRTFFIVFSRTCCHCVLVELFVIVFCLP